MANTASVESTWTPKRIGALVVGVIALIFVFSNTGDATLNWLFWQISAPAWVMLLLLLLAGMAVGFFVGRRRYKQAGAG